MALQLNVVIEKDADGFYAYRPGPPGGQTRLLLSSGFAHPGSKGSHRIYLEGTIRVVLPFHGHRIVQAMSAQ